MIRHLLKLVWNRKQSNALLTLEIFFSFIVLFVVMTLAATMITRYRRPLGFDCHDVWVAGIAFPSQPEAAQRDKTWEVPHRATFDRMLTELRSLPEIDSAAAIGSPAYSPGTWESSGNYNGFRYAFTRDSVTDDYAKVMRIPVLAGRWFGPQDDAAQETPVVIDTDAAKQFGARGAVGQIVEYNSDRKYRIVGIIAPFRKSGEYSRDRVSMFFDRVSLRGTSGMMPHYIVIRVRPGVQAMFEQSLTRRLHAIAPDYTVRIVRLDSMRAYLNRTFLEPAIAASIIAAFLVVMVFLGLSGVLWQNLTRRTREIGLRRAVGATGLSVYRQILLEVTLLSTLAVSVGVLLVAQLPIVGVFRLVTPLAFGIGLGSALATIY
ncbi:MAG TPA: ABC transporter permease, partial [Thermoanaerobaculia bacterium]|nr:ABC transporter permease [Thermoanaerobaculia bacterium]